MKFAAGNFSTGSFYDSIRFASQYGFKGIEMLAWWDLDLELARNTLRENEVTLSATLLGSRDKATHEATSWYHGMVYEDAVDAIVKAFHETAEAAHIIGTRNIVMITGNERSDISREAQTENCVKALRTLAPIAEAEGLTIVLEPLNRLVDHKGYFLNTSADAFELIRKVDSRAVRVLFDIYHQQITEGNLIRNITSNIDLIGHFHIADNPGRNQPGTGEINYPKVFEAIKNSRYDGWLAFECGRTVSSDEMARTMRELTLPYED